MKSRCRSKIVHWTSTSRIAKSNFKTLHKRQAKRTLNLDVRLSRKLSSGRRWYGWSKTQLSWKLLKSAANQKKKEFNTSLIMMQQLKFLTYRASFNRIEVVSLRISTKYTVTSRSWIPRQNWNNQLLRLSLMLPIQKCRCSLVIQALIGNTKPSKNQQSMSSHSTQSLQGLKRKVALTLSLDHCWPWN